MDQQYLDGMTLTPPGGGGQEGAPLLGRTAAPAELPLPLPLPPRKNDSGGSVAAASAM
jgi:hypothetical protein